MKNLLATATLFLVFVTLVAGKPHHELPPELKAVHDNCLEKLGLTNDDLMKGKRNGEFKKRDCFMACMAKESGMITADGNWNKEKVLETLPPFVTPEIAKKISDTCLEKKGADECETVAIANECKRKLFPHPPIPPELKKAHDECKEELNLTDEDTMKFDNSDETTDAGCFMACLEKRTEMITADGVLNKEKLLEAKPPHVPKEIVEKVAAECGDIKGADQCESAILRRKCFKEQGFFLGRHHGPPPKM